MRILSIGAVVWLSNGIAAFGQEGARQVPTHRALHATNVGEDSLLEAAFEGTFDFGVPTLESSLVVFFEQYPELGQRLGLAKADLGIMRAYAIPADGVVVFNCEQLHEGVTVEVSGLQLIADSNTRRPLTLGFADLEGWQFEGSVPLVASEVAIAVAHAEVADSEVMGEPVLLHAVHGFETRFVLAWVVTVRPKETLAPVRILVGAKDGVVMRKESAAAQLTATGTVSGFSTPNSSHLPDYSGNPPASQFVANLKVTLAPGGESGFTGSLGAFNITTPNPSITATATVNLGTFISSVVDNPLATDQAMGLQGLQLILNDQPNDPDRKRFTAQLNAWQWVMQSRGYIDAVIARAGIA